MEAKFQSSFIPNKEKSGSNQINEISRSGRSVPYFIGATIFTIAALASAGVFAYQKYLEYRISNLQTELATKEESLEPDVIDMISKEDRRIRAAKAVIERHIALSSLFDALGNDTLQNTYFESFDFKSGSTEKPDFTMTLKGKTATYASLALQAQVFSDSVDFSNEKFSDIGLDNEGNVSFSVRTIVNFDTVAYVKRLEGELLPPINVSTEEVQAIEVETGTTTASTTSPETVGAGNNDSGDGSENQTES